MNTADLLILYRLYGEHADAFGLCQAFELLLGAQEMLSPGEQTLQDEGRAYNSHGSSGCVQIASKTSFCACTDLSAMAVCHWASEQPVISMCCMMQKRSSPSMARAPRHLCIRAALQRGVHRFSQGYTGGPASGSQGAVLSSHTLLPDGLSTLEAKLGNARPLGLSAPRETRNHAHYPAAAGLLTSLPTQQKPR